MNVEQLMEWKLAGETEVLGENPPQYHFVHQKSHLTWPDLTWPDLWSNLWPAVEASLLSYRKGNPMKEVITERHRGRTGETTYPYRIFGKTKLIEQHC
jgi:hypothetical protein